MTTLRSTYQIAAELQVALYNGGGGTVTLYPGQPDPEKQGTGYAVALSNGLELDESDSTADHFNAIHQFVVSHRAWAASTNGAYFGVWVDTDPASKTNGTVFVDRVVVMHEYAEAMRFAREQNQLAIWDFNGGYEIRTYAYTSPMSREHRAETGGYHEAPGAPSGPFLTANAQAIEDRVRAGMLERSNLLRKAY